MGNLREAPDARSLRGDFQIDRQDTPPSLYSVDRTGMGRPRCIATRTQIRIIRDEGFQWFPDVTEAFVESLFPRNSSAD